MYLCYTSPDILIHGFSAGFHGLLRLLLLNLRFFSVYFRFRKPASPDQSVCQYTDYFAYVSRVVLTDDG